MDYVDGPVALITGASAGIGAALAREYARRGFHLVLTARRADRLQALAAELKSLRREVLVVPADVARDGELEEVVAQTVRKFGRLDVAVANAGFGVVGEAESLTLDDYRRQFETNVFGVLRTFYATLPELKKTRGRFAMVSSVNGYLALPGNSAYAMSKFAVRALANSLRHELRPRGVSVTLISPGFVESEIRHVDNSGHFHPTSKDVVPTWIQLPSDKAARVIARGIEKRKAEQIVTRHGVFIISLARHLPRFVSALIRLLGVTARPQAN